MLYLCKTFATGALLSAFLLPTLGLASGADDGRTRTFMRDSCKMPGAVGKDPHCMMADTTSDEERLIVGSTVRGHYKVSQRVN